MGRSGALKTPEEEMRKAALHGPREAPGGGFPRSRDRAARGSMAPHARSLATRELSRPTLAVIVRGRPAPELVFSLLSETIWGGKEEKELRRTRGGVGWGESGDGKPDRVFSVQERQAADVPHKGPQGASSAWPCQGG